VAVAEADVHQPEALRLADRLLHEGEHRMGGEGPAVDPGEIVQHLFVDRRIEAGRVHLLFLAGTDRELAHLSLLTPRLNRRRSKSRGSRRCVQPSFSPLWACGVAAWPRP